MALRTSIKQLEIAGDPGLATLPASVYLNEINFNKNRKLSLSGYNPCQQNEH